MLEVRSKHWLYLGCSILVCQRAAWQLVSTRCWSCLQKSNQLQYLLAPPAGLSCAEVVAFALGGFSTMPAVRNFSICAALAVLLDFLLQVSWPACFQPHRLQCTVTKCAFKRQSLACLPPPSSKERAVAGDSVCGAAGTGHRAHCAAAHGCCAVHTRAGGVAARSWGGTAGRRACLGSPSRQRRGG